MRKLVVTENITLDGVIDMSAGWFDPLDEDVDQSDITAATTEHREAADALLVGRTTFETFRGFWPQQTDDPTGVSDYLNAVDKYVVSSTLDDAGVAEHHRAPRPARRRGASAEARRRAATSSPRAASGSSTR